MEHGSVRYSYKNKHLNPDQDKNLIMEIFERSETLRRLGNHFLFLKSKLESSEAAETEQGKLAIAVLDDCISKVVEAAQSGKTDELEIHLPAEDTSAESGGPEGPEAHKVIPIEPRAFDPRDVGTLVEEFEMLRAKMEAEYGAKSPAAEILRTATEELKQKFPDVFARRKTSRKGNPIRWLQERRNKPMGDTP